MSRAAAQLLSGETMTSVSVGHIILTPTQPVGSGETMTSVSVGHIILTLTQPVGSGETMTSVSVGHIILTLTQPVGSGAPEWEWNPRPPDQKSRALPTENQSAAKTQ